MSVAARSIRAHHHTRARAGKKRSAAPAPPCLEVAAPRLAEEEVLGLEVAVHDVHRVAVRDDLFFWFFLFLVLWGRKRRRYGDGAKLSSIYVPHNNTKTKKHHHHHYSTLTDTIVRISAAASRSR